MMAIQNAHKRECVHERECVVSPATSAPEMGWSVGNEPSNHSAPGPLGVAAW